MIALRVVGLPQPQGNKTGFVVNGRTVLVEGRRRAPAPRSPPGVISSRPRRTNGRSPTIALRSTSRSPSRSRSSFHARRRPLSASSIRRASPTSTSSPAPSSTRSPGHSSPTTLVSWTSTRRNASPPEHRARRSRSPRSSHRRPSRDGLGRARTHTKALGTKSLPKGAKRHHRRFRCAANRLPKGAKRSFGSFGSDISPTPLAESAAAALVDEARAAEALPFAPMVVDPVLVAARLLRQCRWEVEPPVCAFSIGRAGERCLRCGASWLEHNTIS